jgi:hypothetical protein
MAAKKSGQGLKLGVVKIENDLITKSKLIAADRGLPLATYLSDMLRGGVERDWAKMVRKAVGGQGQEE